MTGEREKSIRIAVVPGSVRPGNYTGKAVGLVLDELSTYEDVACDVLDLAELQLPHPGQGGETPEVARFRETVDRATGVILATPEYHGSFSSVIKVAIENLGFPSVLAGKPVGLLGVAAGTIGAVKSLEQLRGVCSHVGALVLPGPVSVAGVQRIFDDEGRCTDEAVEERIRGVARTLVDYIRGHICPRVALEKFVRESGSNP
jgi:FMN reductase